MTSPTLLQLLLFVHLLAVVVWLGGAFVGTMIGVRLRKAGDTAAMASFCNAFANVAGPLFGGSGILVLLTGIGMVAKDDAFAFSDLWISIGFTLWLVSMVLGAAVVGRRWYLIGTALEQDGATLAEHEPAIRKAVAFTHVDVLVRVVAVFVMVWRPT
jgi:uncharacterized membrane protein